MSVKPDCVRCLRKMLVSLALSSCHVAHFCSVSVLNCQQLLNYELLFYHVEYLVPSRAVPCDFEYTSKTLCPP